MAGIRLFIALLLIIFSAGGSIVFAQTPVPPPREDSQFWNETQIVKPLTPKHDLIFIGALRIGRNWTRPVDERGGVGLAFKVKPYLTIIPTYIHVEYQPFAGRFIHEERLVLNVTSKFSVGKVGFFDRNLLERRVRPGVPDFTVYRNRLQIDYPMRLGKFGFRGYVADEAWYSTQSNGSRRVGWYRNRISVGGFKQLTEKFYAEVFLLYQHDGFTPPGNIPVVGTLFRYTL